MVNEFDPYREALVVEMTTVWPEEYDDWDAQRRHLAEQSLHREPQQAAELKYIRQHTGFRREITVTPADLERIG